MDKILNPDLIKAFEDWKNASAFNDLLVTVAYVLLGVFAVFFIIRWISDHAYQLAMKQYARTPAAYRLFGKLNFLILTTLVIIALVGVNGVQAQLNSNEDKATNVKTTDKPKPKTTTKDKTKDNKKKEDTETDKISSKLDPEVETKIAAFKGEKGEDGSYRDAARQLVSLAGATIDWSIEDIGNNCTGTYDQEKTVAVFCGTVPNKIFVNEERSDYNTLASDPSFLDYIRHELAHREINKACGTAEPAVANGRSEALANSYAIKYLGANKTTLSDADAMGLQYAPDAESDSMAKSVHMGICKVNTDGSTDTSSSKGN